MPVPVPVQAAMHAHKPRDAITQLGHTRRLAEKLPDLGKAARRALVIFLAHIPKGAAPAAGLLARPRRAAHRPWNDHGTPAGSLKNTDRAKSAEPFVPFFAMARRSYLMLLLVIFVCGTDHLIQARKKKKAKRGCGAEKEDCEQHEDCCYPMMCTSPGTTENGDELPLGK